MYTCAFCGLESCQEENPDKFPANCPCLEEAPVTVSAAKDRVLGHNPMAAIYLADSYYKEKLYK